MVPKDRKKPNAFFSGIGKKKKIILYDTLVQQHGTEELVAYWRMRSGITKRHMIGMYLYPSFRRTHSLYTFPLGV